MRGIRLPRRMKMDDLVPRALRVLPAGYRYWLACSSDP
jgi:hypothetical protein